MTLKSWELQNPSRKCIFYIKLKIFQRYPLWQLTCWLRQKKTSRVILKVILIFIFPRWSFERKLWNPVYLIIFSFSGCWRIICISYFFSFYFQIGLSFKGTFDFDLSWTRTLVVFCFLKFICKTLFREEVIRFSAFWEPLGVWIKRKTGSDIF